MSTLLGRSCVSLSPIAICLLLVGPSLAAITASGDIEPDDLNTWTSSTTAYIGNTDTGAPGLVEVVDGSDLLSRNAYLGYEANTTGTVTIDGAGSTWTNSGSMFYIGRAGDGTLMITGGGAVSSDYSTIALSTGSTGIVTVDGEASTWTADGNIIVGLYGNGTFLITNGGLVSSDDGTIGSRSTSEATVDGAGSIWTMNGSLSIGDQDGGDGTLTITNGGAVTNTASYIGEYRGSTGEVTVDGAGSTWTSNGILYVGDSGDGILSITGGGAASSGSGNIGASSLSNISRSTGQVTVDGAGSIWKISGFLYVGDEGDGTLNIKNGGAVTVANTTRVAYDKRGTGSINFGAGGGTLTTESIYFSPSQLSGTGTINTGGILSDTDLVLDGSGGSHLFSVGIASQDNGLITLNLDLTDTVDVLGTGYRGNGSLAIQNGLAVSSAVGVIGYDTGSTGEVSVTGVNSSWTMNTLTVGRDGNGTLAIADGGAVSSNYGYVGYDYDSTSSAVTVDGEGSTWNNSADLYVGNEGDAALLITNGGALSTDDVYMGSKNGSTGVVTVDGAISSWTNTGNLYVGDLGDGTLNLAGGGAVSVADTTYVAFDGDSTSSINFGAGSGALTTGSIVVSIPHLTGTGTIDTNGIVSDYDLVLDSPDDLIQTLAFGGSGQQQDVTVNMDLSNPVRVSGVNQGSLTIGGLSVTSANGYVAYYKSSTGLVTIDGAGSTWNSGTLSAGVYGAGTLAISHHGTVSSGYAYISRYRGSTGEVTVDGNGSTWTTNEVLSVGYEGDGILAITDGGAVSSTSSYVGSRAGSTGQVTVDGAGSTWTHSNTLYVGSYGDGMLDITSRGTVTSVYAYIGQNSNSTGQVKVDGAGSLWTNSGNLYVGDRGDAVLTITGGGALSTGETYVGYGYDGNGAVKVDGIGSTWTNSGDLFLGYDGGGVLTITGGGLVSVAGTLTNGNPPYFDDTSENVFIDMKTGGMLALAGEADGSIYEFYDLIEGSNAIRYWCAECSGWRSISYASYGEDYTLEYLTMGELAGFTLLTVGTVPEPSSLALIALAVVTAFAARRRQKTRLGGLP